MIGATAEPIFEAVFMLLVAELFCIGLLTLPFPGGVRAVLIRWISTSSLLATLAKPLMYFSALVVLAFVFTTIEMYKLEHVDLEATAGDLAQRLQHESRVYRSERNFYLTGFCVVQLLVIARIYSLLKQVNQLEATQQALKKQAEGAAAAYKSLSQEQEEAKKKAKAAPAAGGADEGAAKVEELQQKLREAETARDSALKGAEALKKQAEGLSAEYARLQKDKESLENKLADFDLVMGDEVKKSK